MIRGWDHAKAGDRPKAALVRTLGGNVIYQLKPTRRRVARACLVAVACTAFLAGPATATAEATGTISGTVSEASPPQAAVGGVQVLAFNSSGKIVRSVLTNGLGQYALTGLALGTYKIQFFPGSESKFVGQFYEGQLSLAEATPVQLEQEGETKSGIDFKLAEGATVSGTVTDVQGAPLEGIQVAAFPAAESEVFFGAFAHTSASGEYTLRGLPKGSYSVEFIAEAPLNFAPQYFDEKPSLADANLVEVVGGAETKANINARLQAGGEISGVVTDAVTGKPLANVGVSAFDPSKPELFGFATTNQNGEYTVLGLQTGSYTVEFEFFPETQGASEYLARAIGAVKVTQGSVTPEINAALIPKAPHNSSLPVISGTPAVGQTLSCTSGSWTGIGPLAYAYRWLRDGSAVANGQSYVAQPADQGHRLACEVTATNPAGQASAASGPVTVAQQSGAPVAPPPASPGPPPPRGLAAAIALAGGRLVASAGAVRVPIRCVVAPCTGSLTLVAQVHVKPGAGKKSRSHIKTLVLAKGSFSIRTVGSASVLVRLTSAGKRALARTARHRLSATLIAALSKGASVRRAIVLTSGGAKHG